MDSLIDGERKLDGFGGDGNDGEDMVIKSTDKGDKLTNIEVEKRGNLLIFYIRLSWEGKG